jgi:hypothetical protein
MDIIKKTSLVVGGAVLVPVVGLTAGTLVAPAMATFGTIVAGVGTIHAPLVAGGVAAILQATSVSLISTTGAVVGGLTGGLISVFKK